jgi:hypothetical protein
MELQVRTHCLNGWLLDAQHQYRHQKDDTQLVDRLLMLCKKNPVNRTRGWHHCPFCSLYPVTMTIDGEEISLGSAEIRLIGEGHLIFAAPDLVCHYMATHNYRPPDEFMAALVALQGDNERSSPHISPPSWPSSEKRHYRKTGRSEKSHSDKRTYQDLSSSRRSGSLRQ